MDAATTSAWAWGWDALVALSTIGVVFATFFLGMVTRALAQKTTDLAEAASSDLRAQWASRHHPRGQPGCAGQEWRGLRRRGVRRHT